MKRIIIVYNKNSSQYKRVEDEVFADVRKLKGYIIGKYEIEQTNLDDNARKLAKIIRDKDLVIAAGGDATAIISMNAVLLSGKDAELGALPYGNFNDLSHSLKTRTLADILNGKIVNYYPLEVIVDGKHFRYSSSYVTLGMTAYAVELFDDKKVRKYLKGAHKSSWKSYLYLSRWYFRNRFKKDFLPQFKLNGKLMSKRTTDYCAINSRAMMKVMRGREWFLDKKEFRSKTGKFRSFFNLCVLMIRSMVYCVPGEQVSVQKIEFVKPSDVQIQSEGEYRELKQIDCIEIKKTKSLKVCLNA